MSEDSDFNGAGTGNKASVPVQTGSRCITLSRCFSDVSTLLIAHYNYSIRVINKNKNKTLKL